jgi:hypothetical protein
LGLTTPHYPVLEDKSGSGHGFKNMSGTPGDYVKPLPGAKYTSQEKGVVQEYKGSSVTLNVWLAKQSEDDLKTGGHSLGNNVKHLDSAVEKARTIVPMTVYRGVSGDYAKKVIAQLEIGKPHNPKSFQETSLHESTSRGFSATNGNGLMFRISVPAGTPAIPTTTLTSSHSGETGTIFSRNVSYIVKAVYKRDNYVYADVDLVHPGHTGIIKSMAQDEQMSAEQYAAFIRAATRLHFTPDELDIALVHFYDEKGNDVTDAYCRRLRTQVEQEMRRGK